MGGLHSGILPHRRWKGQRKQWGTVLIHRKEHSVNPDLLRKESSFFRYEIHTPPPLAAWSSPSIRPQNCLLLACSVYTADCYCISFSLATRNSFQTLTPRNKVDISLFPIKAYFLLHSSSTSWISLPAHPFFFWEERFRLPPWKNLSSFLWEITFVHSHMRTTTSLRWRVARFGYQKPI